MGKPSIIILLVFGSYSLRAQVIISNLSLTDTTQNYFYIGEDNLIRISGKQYDPVRQKHAIIGGGGTLHKKERGVYIVRVNSETDDCHIWITENNKPVSKHHFRVRKIGNIIARYGGLKDSVATVNQLLANPFIYVDLPESYYKHNYSITSFSATLISKDEDSLQTFAIGNLLTTEQKETIRKLVPGNKILFDPIYVVEPDGRRRKLKPLTITIK